MTPPPEQPKNSKLGPKALLGLGLGLRSLDLGVGLKGEEGGREVSRGGAREREGPDHEMDLHFWFYL
jgi:hypothetical protein